MRTDRQGGAQLHLLQTGKGTICQGRPDAVDLAAGTGVFSAGGQLEVKGTGELDDDARALMGRRKLVFLGCPCSHS